MKITALPRPREWDAAINRIIKDPGLTMVLGPPDVGKTTFARFLANEALEYAKKSAIVDADPGQKTIGPPSTLAWAGITQSLGEYPEPARMAFIGDTTPYGHVIETVTSIARLAREASADSELTIVDSSGLVTGAMGVSLQYHTIRAISPRYLVMIRRAQEMEPLLQSLSYANGPKIFILDVLPTARRMTVVQRQKLRQQAFAGYFKDSSIIEIVTGRCSIYPPEAGSLGRRELRRLLVGLQDDANETLGIGIVIDQDRSKGVLRVATPLAQVGCICGLNMGFLRIEQGGEEIGRIRLSKPAPVSLSK